MTKSTRNARPTPARQTWTERLRFGLGISLGITIGLTATLALAGCTAPDELEAALAADEAELMLANADADADADADANADANAEQPMPPAPIAVPDHPATKLPLTLLATMASEDVQRSSATLRDEQMGTILNLRVGDAIDDETTIEAIERGRILLRRGEIIEALSLPQAAVRIDDSLMNFTEAPDDDDPGTLKNGVQLGPGAHYEIKRPDNAWGERATLLAIQRATTIYSRTTSDGPKIHIGDLSRRGGGHFPPHLSHRSGRDVDVGYVLLGTEADDLLFRRADTDNLDVPRTWALLRAFVATGYVRIIFADTSIQRLLYDYARESGVDESTLEMLLQYPRGGNFPGGIIRDWPGHKNHFHVRFGAPRATPADL